MEVRGSAKRDLYASKGLCVQWEPKIKIARLGCLRERHSLHPLSGCDDVLASRPEQRRLGLLLLLGHLEPPYI